MIYFKSILIAIDQLINAILFGYPDETLSARSWRTNSAISKIIDTIFFFDPDHCKTSYESEKLRLQSPPEER